MKQYTNLLCTAVCSFVTAFSTLSATSLHNPEGFSVEEMQPEVTTIAIHDLTTDQINAFIAGNYSSIALEFTKGTRLPVSFCLQGDLVQLVESNENLGIVEVQQTFYVKCDKEKLVFSTNKKDWKSLLEFITGSLSVVLSPHEDFHSLAAGIIANQRR